MGEGEAQGEGWTWDVGRGAFHVARPRPGCPTQHAHSPLPPRIPSTHPLSATKKAKDEAAAASLRAQQMADAHAALERRLREAEDRFKRASDDLLEHKRLLAEAKAAAQAGVGDLTAERNRLQSDLAAARKEANYRRVAQVRAPHTAHRQTRVDPC